MSKKKRDIVNQLISGVLAFLIMLMPAFNVIEVSADNDTEETDSDTNNDKDKNVTEEDKADTGNEVAGAKKAPVLRAPAPAAVTSDQVKAKIKLATTGTTISGTDSDTGYYDNNGITLNFEGTDFDSISLTVEADDANNKVVDKSLTIIDANNKVVAYNQTSGITSGTIVIKATSGSQTFTYHLSDFIKDAKDKFVVNTGKYTYTTSIGNVLKDNRNFSDVWFNNASDQLKISFLNNNEQTEVSSVTVQLNNEVFDGTYSNGVYVFDIFKGRQNIQNGTAKVSYTSEDGVTGSFDITGINAEFITGSLTTSLSNGVVELDGKKYVQPNTTINVSLPSDAISGLGSIEVLKDGQKVGSINQYPITDEGVYTVNVTTKAGNTLQGSINNGEKLYISSNGLQAGAVNFTSGNETKSAAGNDNWNKSVSEISVTAMDKYSLNNSETTVQFNINGKAYTPKVKYSQNNASATYTVNFSDVTKAANGIYDVSFKISNGFGYTASQNNTIKVDGDVPVLSSASIQNMDNLHPNADGSYYVDTATGFSMNAVFSDSASGLPNGSANQTVTVKTASDLDKTLTVTDNVGNKATIKYSDILAKAGIDRTKLNFESNSPDVTITFSNSDKAKNGWYNSDPGIKISITGSSLDTNKTTYTLNGKTIKVTNGEVKVSDLAQGQNTLVVTAVGKSGKTQSKTETINYDTVKPTASFSVQDNPKTVVDRILYLMGRKNVTGTASDGAGSGVDKIVVKKDGREVQTITDVNNIKIGIDSDGKWTADIYDKAGNVTEGVNLTSSEGADSVKIDNKAPVIQITNGSKEVAANSNLGWLNTDTTFTVSVTDDNMERVSVEDSFSKPTEIKRSVNTSMNEQFTLSSIGEGMHTITVSARDKAGNEVTQIFTVGYDHTEPSVVNKINVSNVTSNTNQKIYTNGNPVISGTLTDPTSGIKTIEVVKNDTVIDTKNGNGNASIDFTHGIDGSGVYKLNIIDRANNKHVETIGDIVVDNSNPDVSDIKASDNVKEGAWTNAVPTLTFTVKEDNLKSVVTTINGEQIAEGTGTRTGDYTVSTAKYTNQTVRVVVTVTDYSDNITTKTFSYKQDNAAPTGFVARIDNPDSIRNGKVYYQNAPTVTLNATDNDGIGNIKYVVNGKEISGNTFTLTAGETVVSVKDGLGNTTQNQALGEMVGWKDGNNYLNNVTIDTTNPTAGFTMSAADKTEDNKDWYSKDINISVNVGDDIGMQRARLVVNGTTIKDNIYEQSDVKKDTLTFNTNDVENNKYAYNVEIEVTDNSGRIATNSKVIYVDTDAPVQFQAVVGQPSNVKGDAVYYKGTTDVTLSANDGNGVGGIKYKVDGKEINGSVFALSDGEHTVEAVDALGNTTGSIKLSQLLGWQNNRVVIDDTKPTVSITRQSADYKTWYKNRPVIHLSFKDNNGIDHTSVTVNGVDATEGIRTFSQLDAKAWDVDLSQYAQAGADGRYEVVATVTDNAGNVSEQARDIFYVDSTAPAVANFVITGDVNREGNAATINGGDRYSFFFNGNGTVTVQVRDAAPTAGIKSIYTKLDNGGWVEHAVNTNETVGTAETTVTIPNGYKGSIKAYAVDNVTNRGGENAPDMLVAEGGNTHLNHDAITINMPKATAGDSAGNPLYANDQIVQTIVKCDFSGIKEMRWGIGDERKETITNFSGANFDKNLAVRFNRAVQAAGNSNGLLLWVEITDNANNVSRAERRFSIDKDAPRVAMIFDQNGKEYYNSNRQATITINERNFDPSLVSINGKSGTLGSWTNNGETWVNHITFTQDADYSFTVTAKDKVGNQGNAVSSGKFTIDKTAPVMNVTWDNNAVANGKYYSRTRTATVVINEHNFNPSLIKLSGKGVLSGWSTSGDRHSATITFREDGDYSFSLSGSDLAGNAMNGYQSGDFTIDQTKPTIRLSGVENGVSYKKNLAVSVNFADTHINAARSWMEIRGKNHAPIRVNGRINPTTGEFEYDNFTLDQKTDDVYTVTVHIEDDAGNVTEETRTFSVNRFGSSYDFAKKDILNTYMQKPEDIVIHETNVDKLDTSKIRIVVSKNGTEMKGLDKYIHIKEEEQNGKYVYTYTVDKEAFAEDGVYNVQVYSASDDGTNYTSVAEQYTFTIDSTAPTVLITGVENDGQYREYSRKVTIDVRDMSGVKDIDVELNGTNVKPERVGSDYQVEVTESNTAQNISVKVTDKAGNIGTAEVRNFMITSSALTWLMHQMWFWFVIAAIVLLLILLVILIVLRRRREDQEEDEIISSTSSGYGTTSSGNTYDSERTTVEDGTLNGLTDALVGTSAMNAAINNNNNDNVENEEVNNEGSEETEFNPTDAETGVVDTVADEAETMPMTDVEEDATRPMDIDDATETATAVAGTEATTSAVESATEADTDVNSDNGTEAETSVSDDETEAETNAVGETEAETSVMSDEDAEEAETNVMDSGTEADTDVADEGTEADTDVADEGTEAETSVMGDEDIEEAETNVMNSGTEADTDVEADNGTEAATDAVDDGTEAETSVMNDEDAEEAETNVIDNEDEEAETNVMSNEDDGTDSATDVIEPINSDNSDTKPINDDSDDFWGTDTLSTLDTTGSFGDDDIGYVEDEDDIDSDNH